MTIFRSLIFLTCERGIIPSMFGIVTWVTLPGLRAPNTPLSWYSVKLVFPLPFPLPGSPTNFMLRSQSKFCSWDSPGVSSLLGFKVIYSPSTVVLWCPTPVLVNTQHWTNTTLPWSLLLPGCWGHFFLARRFWAFLFLKLLTYLLKAREGGGERGGGRRWGRRGTGDKMSKNCGLFK